MSKIFMNLFATIAGAVVAMICISLIEVQCSSIYPTPAGVNFKDPVQLKAFLDSRPIGAYVLVLLGYAIGSFAGGFIATFLSGRIDMKRALIVGSLLTAAGLFNPDPIWFKIISSLIYLPMAFLGFMVAKKK